MPPKKTSKRAPTTRSTRAKKPAIANPATKKSPTADDSDTAALLARFPRVPPGPVAGVVSLPKRGEPGSWEDELALLPDAPAAPSLVNTHWSNVRQEFWRFEPGGTITWGLSGGLFQGTWIQKG